MEVFMNRPAGHVPTFRANDLADGYAMCARCEQPITREDLVMRTCPGHKEFK
jgi:hypothetical protein